MLPQNRTSLKETGETMEWFDWDGTATKRRLFEITLKRGEFDTFANTFCQVISKSNLMCNSNIQLLMPGPHVMYVTKYASKGNAAEESEDFEFTTKKMENRLSEKRKESDFSEELNRAITALFIHNSGQVVGSSIAKYLTWEKTRFRISHEFCYIPADDIFHLLNEKGVNVKVQYKGKIPYFENYAYHYICRPNALKDKNQIQFYTEYEFCKITNDIKKLNERELKKLEKT